MQGAGPEVPVTFVLGEGIGSRGHCVHDGTALDLKSA
jgi:hypothetical protein